MRKILLRITGADPLLVEMADVYRMPIGARLRYIYLPALRSGRRTGREA